jgi:hypothetical protein
MPAQTFQQRFSRSPRDNFGQRRDLIVPPLSCANGMKRYWNNRIKWLPGNPLIGEGYPEPVGDGVSQMKLSVVFQPMN